MHPLLCLLAAAFTASCAPDDTVSTPNDAQSANDTRHDNDAQPIASEDVATIDIASSDVTDATVPDVAGLELLSADMQTVGRVPCRDELGQFPANIALHPAGGVVGTCSTFNGTTARWWHAADATHVRLIADNVLVSGLDETLVLPDGSLLGTIPNAGVLRYAGMPTPQLLQQIDWPGATFVKGLAFDPTSQQVALGASMLDFTTGAHLPGRLRTFAVNGNTLEDGCELTNSGGNNLTSLGVLTVGGATYWVGVNSEPFGEDLTSSQIGSLIFVARDDCTIRRKDPILGSLGISGSLSIRTMADHIRMALPSARTDAAIYLATLSTTGDLTDAASTPLAVTALPYPANQSEQHFTTSASFSPSGHGIVTCDLNQQTCWQFAESAEGAWSIARTYPLNGMPTNAVWGPEGVWLVAGAELMHIPRGQTP